MKLKLKKKIIENKLNIEKLMILIGILIIPLLYSFFYLKAFYDPYNSLNELPVAIVNKDNGTTFDNKEINLGKIMEKKLLKNDKLDFIVTTEKDATKGVKKTKYYAAIIIPENFSSKIATVNSDKKEKPEIIYLFNEKKNYLAVQILRNAVLQVEQQLQEGITKDIVNNLSLNLKSIPDNLKQINGGVGQLKMVVINY